MSTTAQDKPPPTERPEDTITEVSPSIADAAHGAPSANAAAVLPISMVAHPANTSEAPNESRPRLFPGELEWAFDQAVQLAAPSSPQGERSAKRLRLRPSRLNFRRVVGFDGYRRGDYDEKLDRDRRYGTVYSVSEGPKAYIVRVEMPRKMPASALRTLWDRTREMPDYRYSVALEKNALIVRAGVPDESLRRLAYVSTSFPADFLTRIEFEAPVMGFVQRLHDKILEAIVFKDANSVSGSTTES